MQFKTWKDYQLYYLSSKWCHPEYLLNISDWHKYRVVYTAEQEFKDTYLEKFSTRENATDFDIRKKLTYIPCFATSAIDDIKNAIFQRINDVVRVGEGSFVACANGENGGLDRNGISMNAFIGNTILPNLLPIQKIGVYIDMSPSVGETLYSAMNIHPYIYSYTAEEILNWAYENSTLTSLLLLDGEYSYNSHGLPTGFEHSLRLLKLVDGQVEVSYWDTTFTKQIKETKVLEIPEIPFVIFDIKQALLSKVADYQIALLNLASSTLFYACNSNFTFYTEQFNTGAELASQIVKRVDDETGAIVTDTSNKSMNIGVLKGRRYPVGVERPKFINPSAEPLEVSISYQRQLQAEINTLVSLSVSKLDPSVASANSKEYDERGLEAGLSAIGLELQKGENDIARKWANYEKTKKSTVKYPTRYSLKSDSDRNSEAKELAKLISSVPSLQFKKEICIAIATTLLGAKIPYATLKKIIEEINGKELIFGTLDDAIVSKDSALLSIESIAKALDYPIDQLPRALKDKVDMLNLIITSQAKASDGSLKNPAARGAKELSTGDENE